MPRAGWQRLTVIGALSVEVATNGAVFHAFPDQVLLPELKRTEPDAVLVMDDLGAHETKAVRQLLERSGVAYRYLPVSSAMPATALSEQSCDVLDGTGPAA